MPCLPPFGFVPAHLIVDADLAQGQLWGMVLERTEQLYALQAKPIEREKYSLRRYRRRSGKRLGLIRKLTLERLDLIDLFSARSMLKNQRQLPVVVEMTDARLQLKAVRVFQKGESVFWFTFDPVEYLKLQNEFFDARLDLEEFYTRRGLFEKDYRE